MLTKIFTSITLTLLLACAPKTQPPQSLDNVSISFVPFGHDGLTLKFSTKIIEILHRNKQFKALSTDTTYTWVMTQSLRPIDLQTVSYRIERRSSLDIFDKAIKGTCKKRNIESCAEAVAKKIIRSSKSR